MKKVYYPTAGKDAVQAALAKLERLCNVTAAMNEDKPLKVYSNKDLSSLLGITDKTLRQYRNEGMISYSRVDDKYWYTQDDVDEFLQKHHYDAFASYS